MSNALTKQQPTGGILARLDKLHALSEQLMEETGTSSGSYFQFSGKTGKYSFNGEEIEPGASLVFDFWNIEKGYVVWANLRPVAQELVFVTSGQPIPEIPPKDEWERGHRWQTMIRLPVRLIETGESALFSVSSAGGVRTLVRLFAEFAAKAKMQLDENGDTKHAVVEIDSVRKTGKDDDGNDTVYYVPKMSIIDWVSKAELGGDAAADETEDSEPVEEELKEAPKQAAKPAKPGIRIGVGKRV